MKKVLIAEDELVIVMNLEPILKKAGFEIVGPVATVEKAIELTRTNQLDLALLDVNLKGQKVDPVADLLKEKGVPFAFLTGYGYNSIPRRHHHHPIITKPCFDTDLLKTLNQLLTGAA